MHLLELFEAARGGIDYDTPYQLHSTPDRPEWREHTHPIVSEIFPETAESAKLKKLAQIYIAARKMNEPHGTPQTAGDFMRAQQAYGTQLRAEIDNALNKWLKGLMRQHGHRRVPDQNLYPYDYWSIPLRQAYRALYNPDDGMLTVQMLEFVELYFQSFADFSEKVKSGAVRDLSMHRNVKRLARLVWKDCQKWLRDSEFKKLYRGSARNVEVFRKAMVRPNRRTLGDQFKVFDKINQYMGELGYAARRDNSILCTGDADQAESYGAVGVVFMIGDYEFSWHPEVRDYLYTLEQLEHDYFEELGDEMDAGPGIDADDPDKLAYVWEKFQNYLAEYRSQEDSMVAEAIDAKVEVMLTNTDGYYIVDNSVADMLLDYLRRYATKAAA